MLFRSFRIHCRRASFLSVSRLGCATFFCPSTAAFSLSLEGSKGDVSTPGGRVVNGAFGPFWARILGGVWLFCIH